MCVYMQALCSDLDRRPIMTGFPVYTVVRYYTQVHTTQLVRSYNTQAAAENTVTVRNSIAETFPMFSV